MGRRAIGHYPGGMKKMKIDNDNRKQESQQFNAIFFPFIDIIAAIARLNDRGLHSITTFLNNALTQASLRNSLTQDFRRSASLAVTKRIMMLDNLFQVI